MLACKTEERKPKSKTGAGGWEMDVWGIKDTGTMFLDVTRKNILGQFFLYAFLSLCGGCAEKTEKTLRVVLEMEPAHLHPLLDPLEGVSRKVTFWLYDSLLRPSDDGFALKPKLASGWKVLEGGKRVVFALRRDAFWHDGKRVTAVDVVHTVQAVLSGEYATQDVRGYLDVLQGCRVVNTFEVSCVFKKAYGLALESVGMLPVLPAHVPFSDPSLFRFPRVGSGPFVFERWEEGKGIFLKRNARYYGDKARVEKMVWKFVPQAYMRVQLFKKGDVDVVEKAVVQHVQGMDYKVHMPSSVQVIGWNTRSVFFSDARVRRAMTSMLDREAFIRTYRQGVDVVAAGWFYPGVLGYNAQVKPLPYNPVHGEALLDEAGWRDHDGDGVRDKNGKPFAWDFVYPAGYVLYEQLAVWLKESLGAHGVVVRAHKWDWALVSKKWRQGEFDGCALLWQMLPVSDPAQLWHSKALGGANLLQVQNPALDTLLDEANATLDISKRAAVYGRFAQMLHEVHPYTPLFYRAHVSLVSPFLKDVVSTPYGIFDYAQMAFR